MSPQPLSLSLVVTPSSPGPADSFDATGTLTNNGTGTAMIVVDVLRSSFLALDIFDSSSPPAPVLTGSPSTPPYPSSGNEADTDTAFTYVAVPGGGGTLTFQYPGFVPADLPPGNYTVQMHYIFDATDSNAGDDADVTSSPQAFTVTP